MSSTRPRLEIAGQSDAEAMADLHLLSHTVSFASFASGEWLKSRDKSQYQEQWREFLDHAQTDCRSRAWKVTVDETVVGMVKVSPTSDTEAQLSSMHVHPDYQRRGIGSLLMNAAVEFIRDTGFSSATLGVVQANAPARAIYERHGWTMRALFPTGVEGVPIAVYELKIKGRSHGWLPTPWPR